MTEVFPGVFRVRILLLHERHNREMCGELHVRATVCHAHISLTFLLAFRHVTVSRGSSHAHNRKQQTNKALLPSPFSCVGVPCSLLFEKRGSCCLSLQSFIQTFSQGTSEAKDLKGLKLHGRSIVVPQNILFPP